MTTSPTNIAELTRDLGRLLDDAEPLADLLAASPVASDVKTLAPELRAVIDLKEKAAAVERALGLRRDLIERELIKFHEQTDVDSVRNKEAGITISFTDAMRLRIDAERWKEIWEWAVGKGQSHILYRQLCTAKTLELIDSNVGLPPGVSLESYTKVNVRRA